MRRRGVSPVITTVIVVAVAIVVAVGVNYWMNDFEDVLDVSEVSDVVIRYNTFDVNTSFYTQYTFVNEGNIPATEVKIILTYPAGTMIQRISPPYMKYTESEVNQTKVVELEMQRLDIYTQLSILVTSSHEPIGPPEIQSKEASVGG